MCHTLYLNETWKDYKREEIAETFHEQLHKVVVKGWHPLAIRTLAIRDTCHATVAIRDTCHSGELPFDLLAIWDTCHSGHLPFGTVAIRRHLPFRHLPFEDTCHSKTCHSGHLPFGILALQDTCHLGTKIQISDKKTIFHLFSYRLR